MNYTRLKLTKAWLLAFIAFVPNSFVSCKRAPVDRKSEVRSPAGAVTQNIEYAEIGVDACTLISAQEVAAIQAAPIIDSKGSKGITGTLATSQCFFSSSEANKSVSIAISQPPVGQSAHQFWEETFEKSEGEREKVGERSGPPAEKEQTPVPKKMKDIGAEACWMANAFGGTLYVLTNNYVVRVSVGGPDNEEERLQKSKAIGKKVLERL